MDRALQRGVWDLGPLGIIGEDPVWRERMSRAKYTRTATNTYQGLGIRQESWLEAGIHNVEATG
jgi:hypothetical protein